jgi:WD40 repeat protein
MYSAGADRTIIQFWDVNTGKVLKNYEGHVAEVTSSY